MTVLDARRVPLAILEHWYGCGRKIRFATAEIARIHRTQQLVAHAFAWGFKPTAVRRPYLCDCGWYHLGRPTLPSTSAVATSGWKRRQRLQNMRKAWNGQAV